VSVSEHRIELVSHRPSNAVFTSSFCLINVLHISELLVSVTTTHHQNTFLGAQHRSQYSLYRWAEV